MKSNNNAQVATSISSLLFSFLASSHHWLHMGILVLLGGSTSMMSAMTAVSWIRRFMIIATFVTTLFSIYRLYKHQCKRVWIKSLTVISIIVSFIFIAYTLISFGW